MSYITYSKNDPLSSIDPSIPFQRNLLFSTKKYLLIGPNSTQLTFLRDEIIFHDTVRIEKPQTGNFACIIPGKYTINMPHPDYVFNVERSVYTLIDVKFRNGIVGAKYFNEGEITHGMQRYKAIYSTTDNVAYIKDGAIMVVAKEFDDDFIKSLILGKK